MLLVTTSGVGTCHLCMLTMFFWCWCWIRGVGGGGAEQQAILDEKEA